MTAKIISAFFGCGKTYFGKHSDIAVDLEEEDFRLYYNKRNPKYPNNYIEAITDSLTKYQFVFITTNKHIRDKMQELHIPYILVYPDSTEECYKEWHDRLFKRGTVMLWDNFLRAHFYDYIESLKSDTYATRHYQLQSNEYIDRVVLKEIELCS